MIVGIARPGTGRFESNEHLDELHGLVEAASGKVVGRVIQERKAPDSATWIGKGKASEVAALVAEKKAALVVFDDDLSPAQLRNLEKIVAVKVIDRSMLILDIFAKRARTAEARTQVELAQLEYMLPRLTRQWAHLSRQAGGIGTRGVGETQLEIDRRLVRTRIRRLEEELRKIEQSRRVRRSGRSVFTVALAGYTNAGKSTLFNRLTSDTTYAADKLFATLDSKLRRMNGEMPLETVAADTVGFVRKLPHHLVASFRSTMAETTEADLVLHVVDASHPVSDEQEAVGREVLQNLGVDQSNVVVVHNKVDRLGAGFGRTGDVVRVSALDGRGIEDLLAVIRERQRALGQVVDLLIPHHEAKVRARLYETGRVETITEREEGSAIRAWVPSEQIPELEQFRK